MYTVGDIIDKGIIIGYFDMEIEHDISRMEYLYENMLNCSSHSLRLADLYDIVMMMNFSAKSKLEQFCNYATVIIPWPCEYGAKVEYKIWSLSRENDVVGHIDFNMDKLITVGMMSIKESNKRVKWQEEMSSLKELVVTDVTGYLDRLKKLEKNCKKNKRLIYEKYLKMLKEHGQLYNTVDEDDITFYYYNKMWYQGKLQGDEFYVFRKSTNIFVLLTDIFYIDEPIIEVLNVKDIKRVYGVG